MAKAPDAFRTISEVADWLDTPTHVLRFWESKFNQIKPIKRAGGRRYYRPEDMELLGGIKTLLHDQGMTIKGVQKLLREQGVKPVSALGPSVDDAPETDIGQNISDDPVFDGVGLPVDPLDDLHRDGAVNGEGGANPETGQSPLPAAAANETSEPPQTPNAPAQTKPDFSALLDSLPRSVPTPIAGQPRVFAALLRSSDRTIRQNADRIRPLLTQLQDLRGRMGRD